MKKLLILSTLLVLSGCEAKAQDVAAFVGAPDSANILTIEENYEVVVPAPQPQADWSKEGNIEVAPMPENTPPAPPAAPQAPNDIQFDESLSTSPNGNITEQEKISY